MSATNEGRLAVLERMLALKPADPFVHYARALEFRSLGRGADALAALQGVAENFPDYVPTYLMGGQVAGELGNPQEARRFLERGLEAAAKAGDTHALSELRSALALLADRE